MGTEDTKGTIEVRVEQIGQLFDTLDPFPFRERDLDKDAEEYIVGWAREFPRDQHLKIIIHVPRLCRCVACRLYKRRPMTLPPPKIVGTYTSSLL